MFCIYYFSRRYLKWRFKFIWGLHKPVLFEQKLPDEVHHV